MSFFAGFAGAAAKEYDESTQRWRSLYLEEERLKEQREQFNLDYNLRRDQMTAESGRWKKEFDWRVDFQQMQHDLETGKFKDTQLNGFYEQVMGQLDTLPAEERLELYSTFMGTFGTDPIGGALGKVIEARISSSEYISRMDALAGLNAVLNSPQGTMVFAPLIENYLNALPEAEREKYAPMMEAFQEGNAEDWEQWANTARELNSTDLALRQADIAQTEAAAAASNAQAYSTLGRFKIDEERWNQFDIPLLQNALRLSDEELSRALIDAEYYPAQVAAATRSAIANATTDEARATVANMTVREQIDTIVAAARQAAAEARVAAETADARIRTAESDANVAEGTEGSQISVAESTATHAAADANVAGATTGSQIATAEANATRAAADATVAEATTGSQIATIEADAALAGTRAAMAEEDLRFSLATAGFRESILSWEAEGTEESVYQMRAYIEVLNEQVVDSQFGREQATYELVDSLVQGGRVELLELLGEDILRPMFGDEWEDMSQDLRERAFSQADVLDRRAMAGMLLEEANVTNAQWQAANNERIYTDGRTDEQIAQANAATSLALQARNVVVSEGHLKLAQDELAHRQLFDQRRWEADVLKAAKGANRLELVDFVADATRITPASFAESASTATRLGGLVNNLMELGDIYDANPTQGQTALDGLLPLMREYGIDTDNLTDAASIRVAAAAAQNNYDAQREQLVRSAGIFYSSGLGIGLVTGPEDYGLNISRSEDAALWNDIRMQTGGFRELYEDSEAAVQAIAPALETALTLFAPAMYVGGAVAVTPDTIGVVYESLLATEGSERLEAAGIVGPQSIAADVRARANEYQNARDGAEAHEGLLATRGITLDYNNPQVINAALVTMNNLAEGMTTVETQVLQLEVPGIIRPVNMFDMSTWAISNTRPIPADVTSQHAAMVAQISETYGVTSVMLQQEQFVTARDGNLYINNPTGLANFLQERSFGVRGAADALQRLGNF